MPDSIKFAKEPKVGDYWHEMFLAIALVEHVYPDAVVAWIDPIPTSNGKHIQLSKLKAFTRKEFVEYLTYDSMPDKTWADCVREGEKDA